jgi:2-polyprenyl-3-methyl-5-hydroxy-6-metoxy-1,4-benzoquinol methylase
MVYSWKVRALKFPRLNYLWRYWRGWRGHRVGSYQQLPELVRRWAPGRSFVDIGCLWGVNGEYAFQAEAAGATRVKAVDVFGPTPEFEQKRHERQSRVEFVLGDVTDPSTIEAIGPTDVVLCAGVLYHHPSPFDLLVALRTICRSTLILRSSTIPEVRGLPNAAVFFPQLSEHARAMWQLTRLGLQNQVGISGAFDPQQGYGNWFWGLSPSCLLSMVAVAGFRVDEEREEAFARTLICTPVTVPFRHRLPGQAEARALGVAVSASGAARPA